jgi:uncharacterized protein YfiM (DUF2279 family)
VTAQSLFHGKKERSRKLNKTVIKNAADILSNIATKISHPIATNYPKNAGMATTTSKASEDRKTGSNLTFTDTTEQSAATFAKILKSRCFERSVAVVSLN